MNGTMTIQYPSASEIAVVNEAQSYMKQAMARCDPSHDVYHVQRVRGTALNIAKSLAERNPDMLVVELAAILHDILDKKYLPREMQESKPDTLEYLRPFFESVSTHIDLIGTGRAALISKVIDNVSWSNEKELRAMGEWETWHEDCVELHIVQDADRLEAIGAIGIMRCSAYSSAANRPLIVPDGDPAYLRSAMAHFYEKLVLIEESLKTDLGKQLGGKRHKFMVEFLNELGEEIIASNRH